MALIINNRSEYGTWRCEAFIIHDINTLMSSALMTEYFFIQIYVYCPILMKTTTYFPLFPVLDLRKIINWSGQILTCQTKRQWY